ncbi:hypothetical protein QWA68_015707 [Fusarium oxysporum]|nr:hypothetical protein QWA68_015707 [Fusarium oxysporum]
MAPATRKKTVSGSTGRANSTERDPVADQWEPAGTKRKRDPRDSDTRRTQNQHASATDPKDTGRPATQASRNQTTTYHQGNRDAVSQHRPRPSSFIDLTKDGDDDDGEGNCKRRNETIQPGIKPELLNTDGTDIIATASIACDNLQASNRQSAPEPSPKVRFGIQQGPAETNTPEQLVEELLKGDLEKAKINVEKSKMRLKELEEDLEREKKNLTANQTVI